MYEPSDDIEPTRKWPSLSTSPRQEEITGSTEGFTSASCLLTPSGASIGDNRRPLNSAPGGSEKLEAQDSSLQGRNVLFPTAGSSSGPSSSSEPSPGKETGDAVLPADAEIVPLLPVAEAVSPGAKKTRRGKRKKQRLGNAPSAIEDDGYHWHKYGQKALMEAGFMRAYYRCKQRSSGCPAQKTVDRHQSGQLPHRIPYTGEHDHPAPVSNVRTVYVYRSLTQAHASSEGGTCLTKASSPSGEDAPAEAQLPEQGGAQDGDRDKERQIQSRLQGLSPGEGRGVAEAARSQGLVDMLNAVVDAVRARGGSTLAAGSRECVSDASLESAFGGPLRRPAGLMGALGRFLVHDRLGDGVGDSQLLSEGTEVTMTAAGSEKFRGKEETGAGLKEDALLPATAPLLGQIDSGSRLFGGVRIPTFGRSELAASGPALAGGCDLRLQSTARARLGNAGLDDVGPSVERRSSIPGATPELDLDLRLAPPDAS